MRKARSPIPTRFAPRHATLSVRPRVAIVRGGSARIKSKAMIAASDDATRRMDVDKIMSYYAEDATIELVIRVGRRTGRQFMRKKELAAIARRHKDDVKEYHMRRENLAIDVTSTGTQAEMRSTVIEDWRDNGRPVTMTSEEQHLIEMRDGKLQIVHSHVISDGGPKERR